MPSKLRVCKDCVADGVKRVRPAPHPGPRCVTHHRIVTRSREMASHDRGVQRTYGMGPGDYERLYVAQGRTCYICQRATGKTKRLAVDHNHETGEVRGLLCGPCNRLIGHVRDDPETLERAAFYLRTPPARDVLLVANQALA